MCVFLSATLRLRQQRGVIREAVNSSTLICFGFISFGVFHPFISFHAVKHTYTRTHPDTHTHTHPHTLSYSLITHILSVLVCVNLSSDGEHTHDFLLIANRCHVFNFLISAPLERCSHPFQEALCLRATVVSQKQAG